MPWPKGKPRGYKVPGSGRQKDREPVVIAMREAVWSVFNQLGGIQAMLDWGKENQTDFYKIAAKLMPAIDASQNVENLNVLINVSDAKQSLAERIGRRLIAQRTGDILQ